jgi:hypothetical protein
MHPDRAGRQRGAANACEARALLSFDALNPAGRRSSEQVMRAPGRSRGGLLQVVRHTAAQPSGTPDQCP